LVWRRFRLPDLIQKLPELLLLALAEVKEADSYAAGIVDCLGYTREAKRQPIDAKLNFDAPKDSHGKWPVCVDATATEADIDKPSMYIRSQANQADDNAGVNLLAPFKTRSQTRVRSGALNRDFPGKNGTGANLVLDRIRHV
jgi:hypothetical protein